MENEEKNEQEWLENQDGTEDAEAERKEELLAERREQQSRISELSKKGYNLLKQNMIQEAQACFQEILEEEEYNNYALVGMGDASRKIGRYQESVEYYQKCLEVFPDNNYALFGLADCYKALKQYAKAIEIWERYLQHDDSNVTVLTRVADAYRKVRNYKRSKEIYDKVLEMEPDNPYALIGLGHLHYDFKDYYSALKYWERMHNINGNHTDIRVLTSIGNCHRKLKTYDQGVPFFQRALEKEPRNFYALFGLADCYRGLNQQEESLKYWNIILDIDPFNKVILTRAGDAYRNMGQYEKAEEYYHKALNIEFDTYAILGLAMINKEKGNLEDAVESLQALMKNDPRNHRLYIEAAECFLLMNHKDKAIETLNQFQRTGLRNSQVSNLLDRLLNFES
ncbi:MAG: tetratricopeptide repeat protein [Spirochaetales bacterium]|nr:tetratricopeptide repeat protein [Spirochaetales bacterium]MCF7937069.1 tetratricopeptide repeat protein [Spirochaetales bacterium]